MSVKRYTVTIKLHPDKDADLIERIGQLAPGTYESVGGRNTELKAALRAGLDVPPPPQFDPVEDVRAALDTALSTINAQARRLSEQDKQIDLLRNTVANIPKIVNTLTGKKGGAAASPQDSAELEELKKQVSWLVEAVTWLHSNGGASAASMPLPDEGGTERLTTDELAARDARLSKADW